MFYTESFKKQVVKKALSSEMMLKDICRKLGISPSSIQNWKRLYSEEVKSEIVEIDVAALLAEDNVDVEELLQRADQKELAAETGSQVIAAHIDQIEQSGKNATEYDQGDKYAVVRAARR